MKAVYGLYATPESAQRAVDDLREAGVKDTDIMVISSEPFDEYEFGRRDHETSMSWNAALGGVIGLVIGLALTSYTQTAWPIVTGGMPIVSNWPNMIIVFELTMLGAVFGAVLTFLVTARLPGRGSEIYDPEVSDGKILIGVANPPDPEAIEHALRAGGRVTLKSIA